MKRAVRRQQSRYGFTLVELLVVIAIIGILASIVVPNVTRYIRRGRVAKAVSEIRNIDLALTGMLSDANRSNFRDFLTPLGRQILQGYADGISLGNMANMESAQVYYNQFFYTLLRQGRNADLPDLESAVISKLGTSYMDVGKDPWGNQYRFWMGPQRQGPVFYRSYRAVPENDPPYVYDDTRYNAAKEDLPGQPPADDAALIAMLKATGGFDTPRGYGFPAPRDLPVYVFSLGPNLNVDAMLLIQQFYEDEVDFLGGGDDINNWDNESGWESAPE